MDANAYPLTKPERKTTRSEAVNRWARRLAVLSVRYGTFIGLAIWLVAMSISSNYFLTTVNLLNVAKQTSPIIVIGVGATFVMATGGIDLSVGAIVALVSCLLAILLAQGVSAWLVLPAVLAVGACLGSLNGLLVRLGIPPFIVTLGGLVSIRGLAFVYSNGYAKPITDPAILWFGRGGLAFVDAPIFVALVVVGMGAFALNRTQFGLHALAIGGREEAARVMGLPIGRLKVSVYGISGLTAALGGVIVAARLSNGSPNAGTGLELDVISAVVLGGTSLFGGFRDHSRHDRRRPVHRLHSKRAQSARCEPLLGSGGDRRRPGDRGVAEHDRKQKGRAMGAGLRGRPMTAPIVKMERISKAFGAVRALYLVDLSVERGEVLGLVGDNAAGKSTLMKILSGAYQPDSGAIEIEGAAVAFPGPHAARAFGIEMIYQDYALVPALTVTQNIFLGREILGRWPILRTLQQRRMDERAKALFATLGLRVPSVSSPVRELSGGQQQAVAIVRATGFDAKLVIMDEPTANLGAPAIAKVRDTIARLKDKGVAVILISHRLEDVFAVGDRFVVMKHGRVIATRDVKDTNSDEIVRMIVSGTDLRTQSSPAASIP